MRLVESASKKPSVLNLWHLSPHASYEPAPEHYYSQTRKIGISADQQAFRSMIAHLDAKVGKLLAKLDALRIRNNTLIVFTSDNGGAYQNNYGGLKGAKTGLHEGVPFLVSWPGHVQARSVQNSMAGAVDLPDIVRGSRR